MQIYQPVKPVVRKRFWLLPGALLLALIALVAIILLPAGPREPAYKGKRLSEWLRKCRDEETALNSAMWRNAPGTVLGSSSEAAQAVRHIGKDGLPSLLRMLQREPPAWKLKLLALVQKWNVPFRNSIESVIVRSMNDDRIGLALKGFEILGPEATPAVPDLISLVRRPASGPQQTRAFLALQYIGWEALGPLIAAAADPKFPYRVGTILHFRSFNPGTNGWFAAPLLISCVNDLNADVAESATWSLSGLGLPPEIVLPAMRKAMEDSRWKIRYVAIQALGRLGKQALPVTALLTNCFNDSAEPIRDAATNALNRIAEDVSKHETGEAH